MNDFEKYNMILASGSARRKEILEAHGHRPLVRPMDVDETLPEGISPYDAVLYLSLKKALACEECFRRGDFDAARKATGKTLLVASDTVVYAYDDAAGKSVIMGKPKDEADAWRMLSSIRGRAHEVVSGVTLIGADRTADDQNCGGINILFKRAFFDVTKVFVRDISDEDLHAYIDSGEPFGKAGGYAIQLGFGKYIDHIDGDYENVVGFPYAHMKQELDQL